MTYNYPSERLIRIKTRLHTSTKAMQKLVPFCRFVSLWTGFSPRVMLSHEVLRLCVRHRRPRPAILPSTAWLFICGDATLTSIVCNSQQVILSMQSLQSHRGHQAPQASSTTTNSGLQAWKTQSQPQAVSWPWIQPRACLQPTLSTTQSPLRQEAPPALLLLHPVISEVFQD